MYHAVVRCGLGVESALKAARVSISGNFSESRKWPRDGEWDDEVELEELGCDQ